MGCTNSIKIKEEDSKEKIKKEKKIETKKISTNELNNLITLQFKSENSIISHFISCNENDIFKNIVKKLFEEKPEFKHYITTFLYNGNQIDINSSLKEIKIKDKDIIIVKKIENSNKIEEIKLRNLAEDLKKKTNIDVIIMAKNTKNLVLFKLFSEDLSIKYIFISNEDSIFNENISRLYELNPQYNYQNNYFICNDTKDKVNEYKTLKENNIKNGYLVYLILNKNSVNSLSARSGEEIEEMRKLDSMAYNLKNEKNTEVIVLAKST